MLEVRYTHLRLHVCMSEDSFWEVERSVYFYVGLWTAKWWGTKAGHCSSEEEGIRCGNSEAQSPEKPAGKVRILPWGTGGVGDVQGQGSGKMYEQVPQGSGGHEG